MRVLPLQFVFDEPFYQFETVTLAPYESKLIDTDLLTTDQVTYIELLNRDSNFYVWLKVEHRLYDSRFSNFSST